MASDKRSILPGGLILITLGVLIYLSKAGMYPLGKTWPALIIVVGIGTVMQGFKNISGWLITAAGAFFLANEFYGFQLSKYSQYTLPAVLVLLGIFVLLRRGRR